MSRLDELIQERCPDGVEYKTLSEVFDTRNGYTPSKKEKNFWENGTIPWFRMEDIRENGGILDKATQYVSQEAVKGSPFPANSIIVATSATIGEHALITVPSIANQRFTYLMIKEQYKDDYDPKFLYYYCFKLDEYCKECLNQGNFASVDMKKFAKFQFPRLPIEIQREIVRMLDNYTKSVVELQKQLTAELTARKAQYSHYRDKLLSYTSTAQMEKLGDTCEMKAGKAIASGLISDECTEETPIKCYGGNGVRGYVKNANENGSYPIIGRQGALCGNVKYAEGQFYATEHAVVVKPKEKYNPRFLYHLLTNMNLNQYKSAGAQPGLAVKNIAELVAPVPSLDVQNRIVNVLDNFEKICSDLNIGLPAEIEARQKQYEYYRDKLLTFAETGNTILSRAEQSRAEQSRAEQSRAEQSRAEQSRALIKLLQYVFGYAVVSLQDVVKNSCSGGTPKKGVSEYYEDGNIPWLRTQEVVFRDICKTECFITESAVKNSAAKWIPENCVIVAISGATAGRCAINKIPLTTNQHCLNLEVDPEMALYRYVYYCICAKQEELLAKKEGARGDLNSTRILSLQIDLPSIEKQKRIVSILDRFDAICNDLTSGLPAEIEARQKQYEYYRDKLLTFKEVAAT